MKKSYKRVLSILICCVMVLAPLTLFAACGANDTAKSDYDITYELNYEGSTSRVYPVQSGAKAVDWKATRAGYLLVGWYTDKEGTEKYDFSKKVKSDLTLYAIWREKPGVTTVTFDFGYAGAANKVIEISKESLINEKYKPENERFGMKLVGWYRDAELTTEWNFNTDTVQGETVLHAKYEYTVNIPRNEDGSIKYDNTTVYIWNPDGNKLPSDKLQKLVDEFNAAHEGKIIVTAGSQLLNQADVFLRIQQTPEQMRCYTTYYPIADIFSFAGINVTNSDYFAGALNECTSRGVMLQTPVAAVAPYLVYNKTLMQKYNGGNPLPTTYSELSALLQKVAAGERATNSNFKSILTTTQWMYKEAPSLAAFVQNGADYYTYADGIYQNLWYDDAVMAKATEAMRITYDLFGVNGLNGGGTLNGDMSAVRSAVASGNALMGLISWLGNESAIAADSNLGVISLAGLLTDGTGAEKNRIPVHTVGIGFYNGATNVLADPLKTCAAAEFAYYVSQHAYVFAENGYVPLSKEAASNEAYTKSENAVVQLIRTVNNPENFYTLPGSANLKAIVNTTAAEGVIIPYLTDVNATRADVPAKTKELYSQVAGQVS